MGVSGRPRVLVAVEPDLLRQVLVELLAAVGEDDVVSAAGPAPPPGGQRFSVAVVSAPLEDDAIADVTVVLPPPGEVTGHVRTTEGITSVDMSGPLAVLEALDGFCPCGGLRAAKAAVWGNGSGSTADGHGNGTGDAHHAGSVKENVLPSPRASSTQM